MPIDNEYFKNKQNQKKSDYEPPFSMPDFNGFGKNIKLLYWVAIFGFFMFFARPFVIINSGEVGIIATAGKYSQEPLYPGFHLYIPLIQKVIVVDTKVRLINYKSSEEMGAVVTKDAGMLVNPAINVLDARGLPVSIDMTVQYQLLSFGAPNTISNWGLNWEEKIINPVVRDIVRNVIGNFSAEDLPTKRNEIAVRIDQEIRKNIEALPNKPVKLLSVQLREIVLPVKVKEQIERVQIAKQESQRVAEEVLKAKQEAEKLAAIATGEANAKKIEAYGKAEALIIESKAISKSNIAIARSLTPKLIQLKQIEVQGKFNEAIKENKDTTLFLTPSGTTPNLWLDSKKSIKQMAKTAQQ